MPPVLLSVTPAGNGLAVAVVSVRPGERMSVVVPDPALHGELDQVTLGVLVQLTDRKGTP